MLDGAPTPSVRTMGMWLFIASLTMLFGASFVGYLIIRMRAPEWPPPGSPTLPVGLWVSTALLVVLSLVLALAQRAGRAGRREHLAKMLTVALLFAIAFLASQVGNWMRMASADALPQQNLYLWGFYTLTFLHALHVAGGLVPLTLVTLRARRGRYTAADHEGVDLVAIYWHFLAFTWVAILVVLLI